MNLEKLLSKYKKTEDQLIEILLEIQSLKEANYISESEIMLISNYLGISESKVCSVLSFYTLLSSTPRGKHIIQVCNDISCFVNDDTKVLKVIEDELGIKVKETTRDQQFSLEHTSCIGRCNESPSMRIDNVTYTHLTEKKVIDILAEWRLK